MKPRYLYLALGLLIAINALVLAGMVYNRSGEPEARLTLTERELPLCWQPARDENTGVALCLNVNSGSRSRHWFDAAKLQELGFDVPADGTDESWRISRVLPKKAYVVLEYDGESWREYRQQQLEEIAALPEKVTEGKLAVKDVESRQEQMRFELGVASHLFSVDVGSDPEALRQRYPDRSRYLILTAEMSMHYDWLGADKERRLVGYLRQILVNRLHVERGPARWLEALPGSSRISPSYTYYDRKNPAQVRYQVQISVGRRLEPWVTGVEAYRP